MDSDSWGAVLGRPTGAKHALRLPRGRIRPATAVPRQTSLPKRNPGSLAVKNATLPLAVVDRLRMPAWPSLACAAASPPPGWLLPILRACLPASELSRGAFALNSFPDRDTVPSKGRFCMKAPQDRKEVPMNRTPPPVRTGPPANKGKKLPAEVLTTDEVRALLSACSNRAPTGIRNRALMVAMYRGGLRCAEALALYPKDFDAERCTLTVLHGKGNMRRVVGLDPEAVAVLSRWIDRRSGLGLNGRHPLFSTLMDGNKGKPLAAKYVRDLLPRLAVKAGIAKRVHPHGLRHTHAAELAAEGFATNLVQAQLGHSSLATTDRYLRHIAPVEVVAAMRRRTWSLTPKAKRTQPTPEDIAFFDAAPDVLVTPPRRMRARR